MGTALQVNDPLISWRDLNVRQNFGTDIREVNSIRARHCNGKRTTSPTSRHFERRRSRWHSTQFGAGRHGLFEERFFVVRCITGVAFIVPSIGFWFLDPMDIPIAPYKTAIPPCLISPEQNPNAISFQLTSSN